VHLKAARQVHQIEARALPRQGLHPRPLPRSSAQGSPSFGPGIALPGPAPRVRHFGAARQVHKLKVVELGHHGDDSVALVCLEYFSKILLRETSVCAWVIAMGTA